MFYLARYPKCYERLLAEVRETFADSADIHSGPAMDSCRFLDACIKEGLRMSPPTGGAPWRQIETDCLVVDGHIIPKGCDVATCIYSIHHNEKYFPNSYEFRPERWLQEDPSQDPETAASAWTPFMLGSRVCLGRNLAMMQVTDIMALLVWNLDFRLPQDRSLARIGEGVEGARNGRHRMLEFQMYDHITSSVEGPYLEFRRRAV